jgi:hypothetical protein
MAKYTLKLDWSSTRLRTAVSVLRRGPRWGMTAGSELAEYLIPWDDYEGPQTIKLAWPPSVIGDVCHVLGAEAVKLEIKLGVVLDLLDPVERDLGSEEILGELTEIYAALRDIHAYLHGVTHSRLITLESGRKSTPDDPQDQPQIPTHERHQ